MPSPAAAHIAFYSVPAPGHFIPLLDLIHRLLARHGSNQLIITILVTPNFLHLLQPLLSLHASSGQVQHFLLPSLSPPKEASSLHFLCGIHDHHYHVVLDWLRSQATTPHPVSAIVSDVTIGWTQRLATEAGVPRLSFCPSGAFGFSIMVSMWLDQPDYDDPNDMRLVVFDKIPKSPSQPLWQLCHLFREFRKDDPSRELYRQSFLDNLSSLGMIVNSFSQLERVYLDHVKDQLGDKSRVWAVSPLLPIDNPLTTWSDRGGASSVPSHQLKAWLDSKKDDSVIYVCFGSVAVLSRNQMDTLAASLETSGVHFIWAMRNPNEGLLTGEIGVLGDDFVDRVGKRGLVIKGWAPQVDILRHRAVGTFLSHCGWNSTLEGISVGGVVMLTWPLGGDQYSNEQSLVDELGIGFRVGGGTKKIPEPSELARLLCKSVEVNLPRS